jgi:hypothetical protein
MNGGGIVDVKNHKINNLKLKIIINYYLVAKRPIGKETIRMGKI